MKKTLFLLLLGIWASSCRKDVPISQQETQGLESLSLEKKQIVEECRSWYQTKAFESRKLASKDQSAGADSNSFVGNPDWTKPGFYQLTSEIPEFNRFPLRDYEVNYAFTERMNPKGYRDIMLRKYGEDNFVVDIMEGHPDADYLERKRKEKGLDEDTDMRLVIDNEDYTGYFLIYSADNGLRYGERRDNGVVTSHLQLPWQN